jgi:glycosyltransferase involved in cell wall biosynthesis
VAQGHGVEWFSASFRGAPRQEVMDGVQIVRRGRQFTVHLHAYRRYRKTLSDQFDAVIDEVNTMPFFTPVWSTIPAFMLIHQLAREVWWYETRFPLSLAGFVAESFYLKPYRKIPVLALSPSTERDLVRLGFTGPITVVPPGLNAVDTSQPTAKEERPTLLYVGRLAPSKRVRDIVRAFALFKDRVPSAQLWLVGTGSPSYVAKLKRTIARLRLSRDVRLWGWIPESAKRELMQRAHVLAMASVREGWGLSVLEANACGTPAVVYDVRGLRDSVHQGRTGLLVEANPYALADALAKLWNDQALYHRLTAEAKAESANYSWDHSTDIFAAAIRRGLANNERLAGMSVLGGI